MTMFTFTELQLLSLAMREREQTLYAARRHEEPNRPDRATYLGILQEDARKLAHKIEGMLP